MSCKDVIPVCTKEMLKTSTSAIILAARLKALGVESVMVDRAENPGDNWAIRYDCMRFHLLTSTCELPFMRKNFLFHHQHFELNQWE